MCNNILTDRWSFKYRLNATNTSFSGDLSSAGAIDSTSSQLTQFVKATTQYNACLGGAVDSIAGHAAWLR